MADVISLSAYQRRRNAASAPRARSLRGRHVMLGALVLFGAPLLLIFILDRTTSASAERNDVLQLAPDRRVELFARTLADVADASCGAVASGGSLRNHCSQ